MAAIDPVCKMTVEEDQAADKMDYQGTTYYFCATSCRQKFEADPQQYLVKN